MNADIRIHYDNELRCRIECGAGISFEISEEFSFYVPNYKFMPAYKAGRWDGKIRLYDVRARAFYVGLLPHLYEWSKENGYTYEIADPDEFHQNKIPYDKEELERVFKLGKFEPKWYQRLAVETAIEHGKCVILSPTGSGKSYILYLLTRYLQEVTEHPILITVPSTSLVEQLYSDFGDYSVDGWSVEENCHLIYSGKDKNTTKPVVITTWQSAVKMPPGWFLRYGAYFVDEAHGADAKSISKIIDNMAHCPMRIGLTGTLDGTAMHLLEMQARFGDVKRVATTKQLQDDGDLTPLEIDIIHLEYTEEERKLIKGATYQQEIDFIVSHSRRNKLLAKIAVTRKGNTLMLFNYIDRHGTELYNILKPMCEKAGKKLYYIHGKVGVDEREHIRQILEKEDNAILLASFGTLSTGVNIKNLHNVIFCHPYKAVIKTLQSIGRILRVAAGKHKATLIDVCDDLTYTSKRGGKNTPNTTFGHFVLRLKTYVAEKWKYKIHKMEI